MHSPCCIWGRIARGTGKGVINNTAKLEIFFYTFLKSAWCEACAVYDKMRVMISCIFCCFIGFVEKILYYPISNDVRNELISVDKNIPFSHSLRWNQMSGSLYVSAPLVLGMCLGVKGTLLKGTSAGEMRMNTGSRPSSERTTFSTANGPAWVNKCHAAKPSPLWFIWRDLQVKNPF